MPEQFLKVFQIYFDEAQLPSLDYTPYFNSNCTPYFESEVIKDLVLAERHKNSQYFGVVSYQLRSKVAFTKTAWKSLPNIANHSTNKFTPQLFETELRRYMPDAMSFQRHQPHDPISYADTFHPNFSRYFQYIMQRIGFDWTPTRFKNVFYCNFFVTKSSIYEDFVLSMLLPAMKVMDEMPELMGNSGYRKPMSDSLIKSLGVSHYPYHAFICERMFSYYAHLKKLKCYHY